MNLRGVNTKTTGQFRDRLPAFYGASKATRALKAELWFLRLDILDFLVWLKPVKQKLELKSLCHYCGAPQIPMIWLSEYLDFFM